MDPVELAVVVRSYRRSRARRAVHRALVELGAASAVELAARAGVSLRHVEGVMIGEMPAFSPRFSLVSLGMAAPCMTRAGVVFSATEKASAVEASLAERELSPVAPRVRRAMA